MREDKLEEQELLNKLEKVGDSPQYVWKLFLLCMIPSILNGLNVTSYVYLTDVPGHWCKVTELENTSWTLEQLRQISSPGGSNTSSCTFYDLDYRTLAGLSFDDALNISESGERKPIPCNYRIFDTSVPSMVLDFDLVCERTVYKPTIQVAISLGKFLGAFLFGIVSDKYGRRVSFLWGALLYIVSGPLIALANSYALVIVGRIGLGAAGSGIYHSAYVILSEIVSKRRRASLGILYNMSYPIGQMIVPVVAYFVREWRTLQIVLSVPAILILAFWWAMPESPRWLLSKHRRLEASTYIRAQYNKLHHKEDLVLHVGECMEKMNDPCDEEAPRPPSCRFSSPADWKEAVLEKLKLSFDQVYQLLRYGELQSRMAITFFTWCVCSFSYYGLALNVDNFATDRYVYGFLTGLVEAPSYLLPLPLLRYMGRRQTTILLFYVGGIALLLILAIPETEGLNIPLLVVASIGRLCVSGVFAVVILHTTEMFPTLLRNTAIGIGSTSSHIGSMSAPLFVDLMGAYGRYIPSTAFGCLTIMAGTLTFLLPETKNRPLPNTVKEILNGPKESKVGFHQLRKKTALSGHKTAEKSFKLRVIDPSDAANVIQFLNRFSFRDEPLNIETGMNLDYISGKTCPELEEYYTNSIPEGNSVMAVSNTGELLGVCLSGKVSRVNIGQINASEKCSNEKFKQVLSLLEEANRQADVFSRYPKVQQLLDIKIISVDTSWRGMGIFKALFEKTRELANQQGMQLLKADCTSHHFAMEISRLGFDLIHVLKYAEYFKNGDPRPVFNPPHPHLAVQIFIYSLEEI